MSGMFYYCYSLKSLPDISEWDTNKVSDMSEMFNNCDSLKSFPDISKWDIKNVADITYIFHGCDKKIIPNEYKSFV